MFLPRTSLFYGGKNLLRKVGFLHHYHHPLLLLLPFCFLNHTQQYLLLIHSWKESCNHMRHQDGSWVRYMQRNHLIFCTISLVPVTPTTFFFNLKQIYWKKLKESRKEADLHIYMLMREHALLQNGENQYI